MQTPHPWIVPVGGFLGSGKTTLILAASRVLADRGMKSAAILNDQGSDLVDTAFLGAHGVAACEVTGACFCCQFSSLIDAAEELRCHSPDVIFAEPAGSCTDLSATILQPLKRHFRDRYQIAPLTVLVDPARARDHDKHISFLFDHQIAEADLVAFTKCDLQVEFPALPVPAPRFLSALTGCGVAAWLDEILSGTVPVGRSLLDIDYERYARAEAALGWLNWRASLRLNPALSPAELIGPFLDDLQQALVAAGARIAHLKILDQTPDSYLKAALTCGDVEPAIEGEITASPEAEHNLLVNVRAVLTASELETLFADQLKRLPGKRHNERLQCFSPSAPRPEHRYSQVVR
jgi:Ni2+-binding GTPase involved in maturation of urease and hydrogenase